MGKTVCSAEANGAEMCQPSWTAGQRSVLVMRGPKSGNGPRVYHTRPLSLSFRSPPPQLSYLCKKSRKSLKSQGSLVLFCLLCEIPFLTEPFKGSVLNVLSNLDPLLNSTPEYFAVARYLRGNNVIQLSVSRKGTSFPIYNFLLPAYSLSW